MLRIAGWIIFVSLPIQLLADAREDAKFRQGVRTVLRKHCTSCHNEADKKAGINLDAFDFVVHVVRRGELFEQVIDQVISGDMPPSSSPPMSQEDKDSLIIGLRRILDNALMDPDPGEAIMRRLSHREYMYTIADLLDVEFDTRAFFPSEGSGGEGFDNQSRVLYVTPLTMERYYQAADSLVTRVRSEPDKWRQIVTHDYYPGPFRRTWVWLKSLVGRDEPWDKPIELARKDLLPFAQRAYRRFLSAEEEEGLVAFFTDVYFDRWQERDAFAHAMSTVMKRILVSPHFLFRYEANLPLERPYPISNFELATRMSYLLWSSMPDDTLLEVAYREDLHDTLVLRRELRRMMANPKFKRFTSSFALQWLGVEESLLNPKADPDRFPELTESIQEAMYLEVVEFFHHVFTQQNSLLDLLDSDYTFLNSSLSRHYDLPPVEGAVMRKVDLSDARRGGVLGMGAVLMATSLPLRTSPVLRGQWVLEQLLGERVPPPPPDVPELISAKEEVHDELDLRTLLEKHRASPECSGCHRKMDAIGLGLENFDAIGRWRNFYGTIAIDATGSLAPEKTFDGPDELRSILLDDKEKFARSIARKLFSYAIGRGVEFIDSRTIRTLSENLVRTGFDSEQLMIDLVTSYPFRHRRSDEPERYKDI